MSAGLFVIKGCLKGWKHEHFSAGAFESVLIFLFYCFFITKIFAGVYWVLYNWYPYMFWSKDFLCLIHCGLRLELSIFQDSSFIEYTFGYALKIEELSSFKNDFHFNLWKNKIKFIGIILTIISIILELCCVWYRILLTQAISLVGFKAHSSYFKKIIVSFAL